jgi:hypothetical protein
MVQKNGATFMYFEVFRSESQIVAVFVAQRTGGVHRFANGKTRRLTTLIGTL